RPGTTVETLMGDPIAARSWARVSLAASAANFEMEYGPAYGLTQRPAIDAVFTTCPGRPDATIFGTNARMLLRMPQRLTFSVHSKSEDGRSHSSPPANTPAMLQSTSTSPNVAAAWSARACTSSYSPTSTTSAVPSASDAAVSAKAASSMSAATTRTPW